MSDPGPTREGPRDLRELDARIAHLEQRVAELDRLVDEAIAAGRYAHPMELALSVAKTARSSAFARRESLLAAAAAASRNEAGNE